MFSVKFATIKHSRKSLLKCETLQSGALEWIGSTALFSCNHLIMIEAVLLFHSRAPLCNDPCFNNDFLECLIVANTTLTLTFILLLLLLLLLLVFVDVNVGGPCVLDCMMRTGLLFAFIFMLLTPLQLDIFNLRLFMTRTIGAFSCDAEWEDFGCCLRSLAGFDMVSSLS